MQGRMLLSHNFDLADGAVPALSREAFVDVFQNGLKDKADLQCQPVEHPHWQVEIRFPADQFSPAEVGYLCAEALAQERRSLHLSPTDFPNILILGGLKTTPPTSDAPGALQPGEWGVDVVETRSATAFLQGINWDATIAQKPADSIFKIEWKEP
jgi:hypothetical protein